MHRVRLREGGALQAPEVLAVWRQGYLREEDLAGNRKRPRSLDSTGPDGDRLRGWNPGAMPKKPLHSVGGFLVRGQSVNTFSENLRAFAQPAPGEIDRTTAVAADRRRSPLRSYLEDTLAGLFFGVLSGMSLRRMGSLEFVDFTAFLAGLLSTRLFRSCISKKAALRKTRLTAQEACFVADHGWLVAYWCCREPGGESWCDRRPAHQG